MVGLGRIAGGRADAAVAFGDQCFCAQRLVGCITPEFRALLFSCSQRATSSLPLPFSPVIMTLASVGATFSIVSFIFLMASLSPIISCTLITLRFSTLVSLTSLFLSVALRMVISKRLRSGGLLMKGGPLGAPGRFLAHHLLR